MDNTQQPDIDFMNPRYFFENDYLDSEFIIGEILDLHPDGFVYGRQSGAYAEERKIRKMPYLFREMRWYEDRNIEDLPRYLKANPGTVARGWDPFLKILSYEGGGGVVDHFRATNNQPGYLNMFIPATKQEYETYISQKEISDTKKKS